MFPEIDFFDELSKDWADLENLCVYWDTKVHKISNLENFFKSQDAVSDDKKFFYKPYYVILRTTYQYQSIIDTLYSWFGKLFKIEVSELSWDEVEFYNQQGNKNKRELRAFLVEFNVLRHNLWTTENLSKLVYYSFVLLELLDYRFCPPKHYSTSSLEEIILGFFHDKHAALEHNISRFFHHDLAELIIIIRNLRLREHSGNWQLLRTVPGFITNDVNGIPFTLQSRHDINEVLNRVTGYDATKITNEIFTQYETMRRNF